MLARNVYGGVAVEPEHVARLAMHVRGFAQGLDDVPVNELVTGGLPSSIQRPISAGKPALSDTKP